jgi:hypothetical protein
MVEAVCLSAAFALAPATFALLLLLRSCGGSLLLLLDLGVLDRSLGLRCATSNGKTVAVAMARATAKAPTRR